jgi:hypothetical protein
MQAVTCFAVLTFFHSSRTVRYFGLVLPVFTVLFQISLILHLLYNDFALFMVS